MYKTFSLKFIIQWPGMVLFTEVGIFQ